MVKINDVGIMILGFKNPKLNKYVRILVYCQGSETQKNEFQEIVKGLVKEEKFIYFNDCFQQFQEAMNNKYGLNAEGIFNHTIDRYECNKLTSNFNYKLTSGDLCKTLNFYIRQP